MLIIEEETNQILIIIGILGAHGPFFLATVYVLGGPLCCFGDLFYSWSPEVEPWVFRWKFSPSTLPPPSPYLSPHL